MIERLNHIDSGQFILIAGPCVLESRDLAYEIAESVKSICGRLRIPYVFKASFKKANRSKLDSFTGIGDRIALEIMQEVGNSLDLPVTTDIHTEADAEVAAEYVDMLQIPAFLCRQTDLLLAAGRTGKPVNIKKGQFMSPDAMVYAVDKVRSVGNSEVMLTERGTTFGYQDLVVDYRSIPIMKNMGCRVVLDCTHSLQQPNQASGVTGGNPEFIETIARAGVSVGVDALFIETHPRPKEALSDGANMLSLDLLEPMLERLTAIRNVVKQFD
jgi:2-dehydro-3-deoxyphosphooctonate aldolase (KDO 8-P synthase)